jgi:hypothetical protein
MPTKKSVVPLEIYQIKVTLLGTSPPIWPALGTRGPDSGTVA